jgi:GH15 family glucan-1,4-alpha-glucosidase
MVGRVRIGDYGLIGDTRTAALCSPSGSIDWLCLPRFDGEPVFARLVGGPTGGSFELGPTADAELVRRRYRPGSVVLESVWRTGEGGELVLEEGMVGGSPGRLLPATLLVRRLTARGRPCRARLRFDPRYGVDRRSPRSQRRAAGLVCSWPAHALGLHVDPPVSVVPGPMVEVTVEPSRPLTVVLTAAHHEPLVLIDGETAWQALRETDRWWRAWAAGITYDGLGAEAVARSLITQRLLTYSPSGAPVAAPTTSLPERPGGDRNWDYRYAWPRDASIGIATFLGVGKTEEAKAFLYWLLHASRLDRPRLRPALTVDGKPVPEERLADEWPGYADSRPVRFGNAAGGQHQLDVYGWVVDGAWQFHRAGQRLHSEAWRMVASFADLVAGRWSEPDSGIWEIRGAPQHWVQSKLMAFLALDRAVRMSSEYPISRRQGRRWTQARAEITADVLRRGYDPERRTLRGAYGSDDLDGALLLLPAVELAGPDTGWVAGTVDAVRRELDAGNGLLYRRLDIDEGAFLPCSFWLVQALARLGRIDAAAELFERLLGYGGALGLFGEEVDPATGLTLGNYPQALTHAALIQSALALRDATNPRAARPARTAAT